MSLHSYATSRDKEKRIKSQTCCTNGPRPNLCFFSFVSPFTPPRGIGRNYPTHRSIRPRPMFSIFPLRHLVAQSRSPRHTAQSVPDRFFFLTPPRGAFFPLFFFTPPRGTEQKSPTHCSKGPRPIFLSYTTSWHIFFLFFYTTSWHRAEVPDTLLKQSPTDLCFFYTTSWHRAEVLDALLKRSTTTMRPDKQGQTPLSEHNGP